MHEVLRRIERAEDALADGHVAKAFDAYALVYRALTARWPAGVRTEEALDGWFEGLLDGPHDGPPISEALSDLLWMRVQLDDDERPRRRKLHEIANDVEERLAEEDPLLREARLTRVVLDVVDDLPTAATASRALCLRYDDDPWIRLELSRACGRLRPPERRDLDEVSRYAHEALDLGGGETDLYVYEDLAALLEEAGLEEDLAAFEQDFWTPPRVGLALRTYGPEPPLGAIEAAERLSGLVVPTLVAVLDDDDVWESWSDDEEDDEIAPILWWAAVHAIRLAAALGAKEVAPAVARWLTCERREVREAIPLLAARLGLAVVRPFERTLRDRDAPLEARRSAITALSAAALRDDEARVPTLRVLRMWMGDEEAPRSLRTEAAYRLAMLRDEPSRAAIEGGLASGDFDRFLFDEEDVTALFEDERVEPARELGLDEPPLACYREGVQSGTPAGADEVEVEALTRLLETLSRPLSSPGQEGRSQVGGATAQLDRARLRLAGLAMEELGLNAWHDALLLFLGASGRSARDCVRLALEWPFADFLTLDVVDRHGRSVAQRLLAEPPIMSAEERQAVGALARSRVVLLEALEPTTAGEDLSRCRDVLSGEPVHALVPGGLETVRWDLLLGRIVPVPDGPAVLLYAHRLPRGELRRTLHEIHAAARSIESLVPPLAPDDTAARVAGAAYLAQTVRASETAPQPPLRDAGGAEIVFCEAVFDVADLARAVAAAASIPGMVAVGDDRGAGDEPAEGPVGFRWLGPEDEDPLLPNTRSLYGELVFRDGRAVLSCHTRERLDEGHALLQAAAGDAVHHRADTFSDPGAIAARLVDEAGVAGTAAPAESRDLVRELLRRHYERWLDLAIPALDGKTPRQAAHDPATRPSVEELIRIIENIEGHRARSQGFAYDTNALREELGLSVEP